MCNIVNVEYRDGLLFSEIEINNKGRSKVIENIVIDTGAAVSILSSDAVADLGIFAEPGDRIVAFYGVGGSVHYSFVKSIDEIKLGERSIKDINIDFGIIDNDGKINGLLGLDLLLEVGAIIDLKQLSLEIN